MGFKFTVSNRLAKSGNDRTCIAFAQDGITLAIGKDVSARIDERADKSYATQVYYCQSIGATRMEEEKASPGGIIIPDSATEKRQTQYNLQKQSGTLWAVNICAYKTGTVFPDEWLVFGAHFDVAPYATPPTAIIPGTEQQGYGTRTGAYDNAAGSSMVLTTAKVLADFASTGAVGHDVANTIALGENSVVDAPDGLVVTATTAGGSNATGFMSVQMTYVLD